MKAIFIPETGGLEVLTYGDMPEPEIGAGDLLVRVKAAALNRRDLFAREGSHGVKPPLPHVPGMEVAGEVVADGVGDHRLQGRRPRAGALPGRRLRRAGADGSRGRVRFPRMDARSRRPRASPYPSAPPGACWWSGRS